MRENNHSGLGDLMSLRETAEPGNRDVQSIIVAGNMEDCIAMEHCIKELFPSKSVIPVLNSDELIQLLSSYIPDLLIMDLQMPCKKGVECLKQIREMSTYDPMPIVAYSTNQRQATAEVAYGLGASFCFTRPKGYPDLKDLMREIVEMDWRNVTRGKRMKSA
jgi:CheY-like chemotaxis protein